jgi:hypothetical protein
MRSKISACRSSRPAQADHYRNRGSSSKRHNAPLGHAARACRIGIARQNCSVGKATYSLDGRLGLLPLSRGSRDRQDRCCFPALGAAS